MNSENLTDFAENLTFSFPGFDSERRLRELVLYIVGKCANDPTFGAVKLRKILFFADYASYNDTGKPITGATYIKLDYGPVAQSMDAILLQLEQEQALSQIRQAVYDYERVRYEAHRAPQLELFTAREIALIDDIIEKLWNRTAQDVSHLSHGIVWQTATLGEPMPYEAFLISDAELSEIDIQRAQELIEEHGWDV